MIIETSIGLFILGLIVGSFLSAAIYRMHKQDKSVIHGRSICTSCEKKLGWKDLIPVASYIFLVGKCRYCKTRISIYYPLLEILTGAIFVAIYLTFGLTETAGLYILLSTFLIGVFFEDLIHKEISNGFMIPATILAFAIGAVEPLNMLIAVLIAFVLFGGQIFLSKGRWLGGGDLKFGIFMGILLGWKLLLIAIVISYVLGALISIYLILSGKAGRKTQVAFGPFLIIGTFTTIFYGEQILNWYLTLYL